MLKRKINISNKNIAVKGALLSVASAFAYSILVMIYALTRSSVIIYNTMPKGEKYTILWANGISIAYSVAVFSVILALISIVTGAIGGVILKQLLLYFNPQFNFRKTILISCIAALALLILFYLFLYVLLKDLMTFNYFETFLFWFLFPAAIFFFVCVFGGSKLNKFLHTGMIYKNT